MEEQAEPFFARAAKADPEMSPAVFNLGKLYHDQEQWNEAIVTLEEWLRQETGEIVFAENAPEDDGLPGLVYDMLGTCYAQKGDHDRAREMWEQALSLNLDQAEIVEKLEWLPRPLLSPVSLTIDR
jgi:tetratricopeptide (TPR) repeat protein